MVARSCSTYQRMYSKSLKVDGVSIGRAKYRQHLAVQCSHSTSSGRKFSREGLLRSNMVLRLMRDSSIVPVVAIFRVRTRDVAEQVIRLLQE